MRSLNYRIARLMLAGSLAFLLLGISSAPTLAASSHTFAEFDSGTITGGAPALTTALDVSGLPASDYLFYVVTADFVPGANPAWSETLQMQLSNGSGTTYTGMSGATTGWAQNSLPTTLIWTGVMHRAYTGGGTLSIHLRDAFTDAGGPYASDLNNVTVTIYPAVQAGATSVALLNLEPHVSGAGIAGAIAAAIPLCIAGLAILQRKSRISG
ncbi:MAG: hypothetical protein MUF84_14040 [Anaerolineae bacterium]|nr:hypothetical protein [Anaerolineae bacterium]